LLRGVLLRQVERTGERRIAGGASSSVSPSQLPRRLT
jgi:hypothetical protein